MRWSVRFSGIPSFFGGSRRPESRGDVGSIPERASCELTNDGDVAPRESSGVPSRHGIAVYRLNMRSASDKTNLRRRRPAPEPAIATASHISVGEVLNDV